MKINRTPWYARLKSLKDHPVYSQLGPLFFILGVGLIAYWSTLTLNFFWEDPFDIGQVDAYSYGQLFGVANSNSYYRPLALVILKALKSGLTYTAFPYHLFNVAFHLLAALLLYGFAKYLFQKTAVAFGAGLLFVTYPISYEAPARASSMHSLYVALTLIALWAYAYARQKELRLYFVIPFLCSLLAPFLHENGILLPPLVVLLEVYLVWQFKRRPSWIPLVYFLPTLLFVGLWLLIPKNGEAPAIGFRGLEALYLSQGLTFPFARLLSQLPELGLTAITQAFIALLGTSAFLIFTSTRQTLLPLCLAFAWWVLATSLIWVARPMEYLEVSPRVMYFSSWAAALVWSLILFDSGKVRRWVGGLTLSAIFFQSWLTLAHTEQLYLNGSRWMDQVLLAGKGGERLLFINAPDRFMYREPLYPLGYWGMLIAPVSQDLSDFVRFTTGVKIETKSLSDFQLMKPMMDASPYFVNTRGSNNAHASEVLYDSILWADKVFWTTYAPDGSLTINYVGDVRASSVTTALIGQVAGLAEVRAATVTRLADPLQVTLWWRSLTPAKPTDTIFVHVLDSSGALVGQGDGESLQGLLPPSAWRVNHEIEDVRTVIFAESLPTGKYRVTVGIYNRADGKRYPAFDRLNTEVYDGELEIGVFTVP